MNDGRKKMLGLLRFNLHHLKLVVIGRRVWRHIRKRDGHRNKRLLINPRSDGIGFGLSQSSSLLNQTLSAPATHTHRHTDHNQKRMDDV